jgi:hypothetical protein
LIYINPSPSNHYIIPSDKFQLNGGEMTLTRRKITTVGVVLAVVSLATLSQAQTVDTRMGILDLEVGYPSKATAEKLYDEMDF